MNKILLLFCLIFNLALFSQNTISIDIKDCRKDNYIGAHHSFGNYSLYRNDSLYGKYNVTFIDSLPDGKYHIEYNTYFGLRKSEPQQINNDSFFSGFEVCIDELPDELRKTITNLYIDNLKDGDELPIYRNYPNCYTKRDNIDSLIVKKEKGKYFIVHNKKWRKLNQDQLNAVRDFEIQMRCIKNSEYYSTAECYTWIKRDNNIIGFQNPSGNWEGYEYLLIQLGFVKKRKSFYFKDRYR